MFKKISLIVLFPIMFVGCAKPGTDSELQTDGSQSSIIGGDKVSTGSNILRSTVGLYDKKSSTLCTGTLIASKLVLTAAHCVDPASNELVVFFGKDMKGLDTSKVRRVVKAVQYYGYNPERVEDVGDIAMLRFEGELPAGYAPVNLFGEFGALRKGSKVVVAGYGLSWAWGIKRGSGTLRTTKLSIKKTLVGRTEIMLDQSLRKGICSGDSGGPAYIERNGQLLLMGVASRGDSLPIPLTPDCFIMSIFTRVDAYGLWIFETGNQLMAIK